MHVAFLSHTGDIRGGGERSLIELIRHVERDVGHRATLISPAGPLLSEADRLTTAAHIPLEFTILRRSGNPLRLLGYAADYLGAVRRLRRTLRRLQPDVLHANSAPAALYAGIAALGIRVPVIWHMRDIQPPALTFRLVLPLIGRLAAHVIAISGAVKENLLGFGIPAEKISVVHNAVRPPRLEGGEALRREIGLRPDHLVVGVIGQMLHRKGQLTAVRAFARLAPGMPHARLLLCGGNLESDYGRSVKEEVATNGLADRVRFTGFLSDPGAIFDTLDILLVPSNQEPFGRVVVEGMFAGKAVVASRIGGIPELIRDGTDGLLVPKGDAVAMATALNTLAGDPERRRAMGESGRRRAAELFSWAGGARADAFARIYRRVVQSTRGPRR